MEQQHPRVQGRFMQKGFLQALQKPQASPLRFLGIAELQYKLGGWS
jgi:hypothetical protein